MPEKPYEKGLICVAAAVSAAPVWESGTAETAAATQKKPHTPSSEPRVSALILARNEAHNLPECLAALAWADERIVVVDPSSQDETEDVAHRVADRVAVRPFEDFASQRNAALSLATGDWVFAVDADERSSPAQATEIRRRLADPELFHAGFRVPIRSVILGRPFRFCGTQLDRPLRLFQRDRGRWVGAVHETVDLDGAAGFITTPLSHRSLPDMQTFLAKINTYTTLEAQQFLRDQRPLRLRDLALRPFWTFLKLYIARQGFRDGPEGLAFCALSGLSVAVRHWKHRELLRAGRAA